MSQEQKLNIDYGAGAGFQDDDAPNYHSEPQIMVDHGRRPRIKRPSPEVYRLDPDNRYRPTKVEINTERELENLHESRERNTARLLVKIARDHAPKLARYRDDHIPALIERQDILVNAKWVAASLPADAIDRVMRKFEAVLWEEIRFWRQNQRITKS